MTTRTVKRIILERVEGRVEETDKKIEVNSFLESDVEIRRMAKTSPTEGYDKVKFTVEFNDGYEYVGRFDMKREHSEYKFDMLINHMVGFLKFLLNHTKDEDEIKKIKDMIEDIEFYKYGY